MTPARGDRRGEGAVVLLPTYRNAATLESILARVDALGLPMIVVDDGSTDDTPDILAAWSAGRGGARTTVVTHPVNRGKAAALATGFAHARSSGFDAVVTIDTDGQLDPEEIPDLLAAARRDRLVLGARDETRADYPGRSRFGRRLSNLALLLATGLRIADSQCGLRAYPAALLDEVACRWGGFAFEAEIIARAAWAGFDVANVPVTCRYFTGDDRVTHFHPVRDGLHGALAHAAILGLGLLRRPGSAARRSRRRAAVAREDERNDGAERGEQARRHAGDHEHPE